MIHYLLQLVSQLPDFSTVTSLVDQDAWVHRNKTTSDFESSCALIWALVCETTLGMCLCVIRRARLYTSVPNRNVIVLRWFCDWKLSVGWFTAFDCLEISGPALTLQPSHSAKVPRPLEGSPGSWLGCTCRVTNQSLLHGRKLIKSNKMDWRGFCIHLGVHEHREAKLQ